MEKINVSTQTFLHPVTIFWDVENVQIPRNKSIEALIQKLRDTFCVNYMEENIFVVCDVFKEKKKITDDLVLCNCTVVHVPSLAKNAADHKLETFIRKFAEKNIAACIVIISSDINFLTVLTEAKYRFKNHIIILHNSRVNQSYLNIANTCIVFSDFVKDLPNTTEKNLPNPEYTVEISNLPKKKQCALKRDLEKMCDNTGGKVQEITEDKAILKYTTSEAAQRCVSRLHNIKLKGKKMIVNEKDYNEASSSAGKERQLSNKQKMSQELLAQIKELFKDLNDIPLHSIQRLYSLKYGKVIDIRATGHHHVLEFIKKYPHIFKISGKDSEKSIYLRKNYEATDSEDSEQYSSEPEIRKKRKM